MRTSILSKAFQGLPRTFLLAALASIGSVSPAALWGSSITAYRDPSGRVIFINEADATTSPDPAVPAAPSESSPTAASGPVRTSTPKSEESPQRQAGSVEPRMQTIATTAVSAKSVIARIATPRAAPVAPGGFEQAWNEIIDWTAARHQVDPDLVRAIVRVESNFNPRAVSRRGAMGLMQLIPATARRFGVSNVFDPRANLDGGVRYLKYLMNQFGGDVKLSLAAYNAGENAVGRHNGVPPFRETQDYIRKIAELYPLSSMSAPKLGEPVIQKFIDGTGTVHFSNTDLP